MFSLVLTECQKIAAKPRSYIGLIAISIIVGLIHLAMFLDGMNYISFVTGPIQTAFILEGHVLNGNLVCFIILQTLIIQIPLLVALVTGDLISGEAAMGTLRLLATKPISRMQIVLSKFMAGAVYTFILLFWLGIISLGLGLLFFGSGDLIVLKSEEMVVIPGDQTLWRFYCAFGIAFLSLLVVASFSMALSCFADNSIGPIISTMAVIILFTIIGTMEIPFFDLIKPYLFTTHMVIWRNFFDAPLPIEQIQNSVLVLVLHIVFFLSVSIIVFKKKDILS
jgi:ABC-2 type transport system permease protein